MASRIEEMRQNPVPWLREEGMRMGRPEADPLSVSALESPEQRAPAGRAGNVPGPGSLPPPGRGMPAATVPEAVPQGKGPTPVWRSLLSLRAGQRALALSPGSFELFEPVAKAGVLVEWDVEVIRGNKKEEGGYDLVLEDWGRRDSSWRPRRVHPFLSPGGRWVAVMQGRPCVGWSGRAALSMARRERFEKIETYYAHPSLWSPQIVVPLDRPEPFRYFLDLASGVPTLRQRLLAAGLRALWGMGIHREVLPNLIVVARRAK